MAVYQYSEDSLRKHLLHLYEISCRAGGLDCGVRLNEAGREAAAYLYENMQQAGLDNVRQQFFTTARWWPEEYSLSIHEDGRDKPLTAFPLWYTKGIESTVLEVVDVGYGTPGEMRGKNVKGKAALLHMKRIFHFIQTFERTGALEKLLKRGAAAVIVMDELHNVPGGMLAVSHKEVMKRGGKEAPIFPLPCMSIGKAEGQELLRRMATGKALVKMQLKVSVSEAEACNIIGELPGNGESSEVIVVGGHYDSWFGGALDNLASQGGAD